MRPPEQQTVHGLVGSWGTSEVLVGNETGELTREVVREDLLWQGFLSNVVE